MFSVKVDSGAALRSGLEFVRVQALIYEPKNVANFLMSFLIRMGLPSLMLMFWGSTHLEQCGSAAPL